MNKLQSLAAALALAGLCSAANAAGSLVMSPVNSSVLTNAVFNVDVRGASFTDNVVGGGFNMAFDAAVLTLNSVTVNGSVWDFLTSPGTINNVAGTLTNTYFNAFANLPTGNFAIATLNFTAKAPGTSALTLSASADFPFADEFAQVIAVNFGAGSVTVSAVPEPSSWAMMALGLAVIPMVRRRLAQA